MPHQDARFLRHLLGGSDRYSYDPLSPARSTRNPRRLVRKTWSFPSVGSATGTARRAPAARQWLAGLRTSAFSSLSVRADTMMTAMTGIKVKQLAGTNVNQVQRGGRRQHEDDLARWLREAEAADEHLTGAIEDAECRANLLRQLLACRLDQGLSQAAVAAKMETTQSAVSELEGGLTDPRLSTLQRYARAANCQLCVHLAVRGYGNWLPLAEVRDMSTRERTLGALPVRTPTSQQVARYPAQPPLPRASAVA